MAIELVPLPLPASADASKFADFGREVKGIHPGTLTPEQFEEIQDALYRVCYPVLRVFGIRIQYSRLYIARCTIVPRCDLDT